MHVECHTTAEREREGERQRHVGMMCWLPFWHLTHIHSVSMFRISPPKRTQRVYGSWPMALATRARAGIPWHSLPPLILEADGQTDILSNQFHSDPPSSTPIPPFPPLPALPLSSSTAPLYLSIHPCRIVRRIQSARSNQSLNPNNADGREERRRNGLILLIHGNAAGGAEAGERGRRE